MEFIKANWLELSVLALFLVVAIIYIAWLIKKKGLRGTVIQFILEAESSFNQGDEKLNYVIDKVIAIIPMPFTLFITRESAKKFIQKIFDEVKTALDYKGVE